MPQIKKSMSPFKVIPLSNFMSMENQPITMVEEQLEKLLILCSRSSRKLPTKESVVEVEVITAVVILEKGHKDQLIKKMSLF